jgi:chromosome segregation ATPase
MYGALDQMSAELHQLREQSDAFDALAEAMMTRDGWLAYRAEALRDQLMELEGQSTARPSAIERVRTALIDRDEALQQARGDLERARTVATDWEAEVVASGPRTGRSARSSRKQGPSKVGPRRGRGRLSRRPRKPKN